MPCIQKSMSLHARYNRYRRCKAARAVFQDVVAARRLQTMWRGKSVRSAYVAYTATLKCASSMLLARPMPFRRSELSSVVSALPIPTTLLASWKSVCSVKGTNTETASATRPCPCRRTSSNRKNRRIRWQTLSEQPLSEAIWLSPCCKQEVVCCPHPVRHPRPSFTGLGVIAGVST